MKFYSEKLNKMFDTAAEVVQAEEVHDKKVAEEKAKKEQLVNARKSRADEVKKAFEDAKKAQEKANEAYKKANEVLSAFCKDYGAYHETFKEGDKLPSWVDLLFSNWPWF